ncbi:MAG: hypothetical protein ACYC1M_06490 [Armatimonadota bacterium]
MLANAISAVVAAVAATYICWRYWQDGKRSWFLLLAVGFTVLAYEVLHVGQRWPVSVGIVMLAVAMIAVVTDVEKEGRQKK